MSRRTRLIITAIVLAAKLLLFIFFVVRDTGAFVWPDTVMYTGTASTLLDSGRFERQGRAEIFRVPGYPLFVAAIMWAVGSAQVWLIVPLQVLLGLLTAILVRRLALESGLGSSAADAAYLVVLIDPAVWLSEFAILSEILFMVLLAGAMLLLVGFLRRQEPWRGLSGFLLLTCAAFVRPIALYLPALLGPILLLWAIRRRSWRCVAAVVAGVLLHAGAASLWMARAERHYGVPVFSTVGAAYAYHYLGAAVIARAEGRRYSDVQRLFEADVVSSNPAVQARVNMAKGLQIVRRYPMATVAVVTRGAAAAALDPGTYVLANMLGLRQQNSGIIYKMQELSLPGFVVHLARHELPFLLFTSVGLLWVLLIWAAVAAGLLTSPRGLSQATLLLVIAYMLLAAAGPSAHARFRVPVVPLLAVFAGQGFLVLRATIGRWRL